MALYEHVFLARQDLSQQQIDALVEQYKGVIEGEGGSVGRVENWGIKSLTYRINKNRKAHYTLMNIAAPPAAIAEMERQMRLNEDVMRFLTIRVDEFEEGPSAMMRREARDDRRGPRREGDRDRDRDRRPRGRPPERAETGSAKQAEMEAGKQAKAKAETDTGAETVAEAETVTEAAAETESETEAS